MHRLYSMFPLGLPGAGLVLLRLSVAITLWPLPSGLQTWVGEQPLFWLAAMLFIALAAGIFTPVMATACLFLKCVELAKPSDASPEYLLSTALTSLALFLLGPGAYSLDSHLYGRRVLTSRSKR
jgi:hypothetical protein